MDEKFSYKPTGFNTHKIFSGDFIDITYVAEGNKLFRGIIREVTETELKCIGLMQLADRTETLTEHVLTIDEALETYEKAGMPFKKVVFKVGTSFVIKN